MSLDKINIWAVTDGSKGMISQVMGLSNQISKNITEIKTDLIFPWNNIQPGFLPIYKWIFKNNFPKDNEPTIVISCGRKSVYFSLYCKKIFKDLRWKPKYKNIDKILLTAWQWHKKPFI